MCESDTQPGMLEGSKHSAPREHKLSSHFKQPANLAPVNLHFFFRPIGKVGVTDSFSQKNIRAKFCHLSTSLEILYATTQVKRNGLCQKWHCDETHTVTCAYFPVSFCTMCHTE